MRGAVSHRRRAVDLIAFAEHAASELRTPYLVRILLSGSSGRRFMDATRLLLWPSSGSLGDKKSSYSESEALVFEFEEWAFDNVIRETRHGYCESDCNGQLNR